MGRERLILSDDELEKLGFERMTNGKEDDPFGFWFEIRLSEKDSSGDYLALECDAFRDFSLTHPVFVESTALNFKSKDEIEAFVQPFKREYNHAFSFMLDLE